jgi:hypothetical protein
MRKKRVRKPKLGVFALAIVSSPAISQELPVRQFDLECSGKSQTAVSTANPSERTFTKRLRIDLDTGLYCFGECIEARKIAQVDDQTLLLTDRIAKDQSSRERTEYLFAQKVYRSMYMAKPSYRSLEMGTCKVLEFSGIPKNTVIAP